MNKRDPVFDIMKGVGIVLVLIGHVLVHGVAYKIIASFHMPVFFLLSGYFCHRSSDGKFSISKTVVKNSRRLLLPYLFTMLLLVLWGCVQSVCKGSPDYAIKPLLSSILGVNDPISSKWGNLYIGPMWFLLALFFAKTIFELIINIIRKDELVLIISFVLSILSLWIFKFLPASPWCVIQGLGAIEFLAIGWYFRNHEIPLWLKMASIWAWPVAIAFSSLELSCCHYGLFPVDVLGACGGTYFLWWISSQINKLQIISNLFVCFGFYSLAILCFHNFEWFSSITWSISAHLPFAISGNWMLLLRLVITLLLTYLAVTIPGIKRVYV